jgi:hypothetical protein
MSKNRRNPVQLNKAKFAAYATAGAAAAIGGANAANADITYVDIADTPVQDTALGGGAVGVNLLFGDGASFNLALAHGVGTTDLATGYAFTIGNGFASPGASVAGFAAGSFNYVSNLASGTPVNTLTSFLGGAVAGTMAYNAGFTSSQFLAAGTGFIGVRFNTNAYGWVRVTMNGSPLNSFTILDYAWADPGESINVGQTTAIPEPGTLSALAMGAAAVGAWRRRRKQVV